MTADYADYQTPQAHADQIASTGVPLLAKSTLLFNNALAVAGAGQQPTPLLAFTQIGYEVLASVGYVSTPSVPFVRVQLLWSVASLAGYVASDTYILPGTTLPGGFITLGRGLTKGDSLTITVTNLDPSVQVDVSLQVVQHSRVVDRDRWQWDNNNVSGLPVAGWTLPHLPADERVLGMFSASSVPAGGNTDYLIGMHDGLVDFGFDLGGGALSNLVVQVSAQPGSEYVTNNPIYGTVNPASNFQVACPRSPTRLRLHNNGTTTLTVTWSAIRAD